MKQHPDAIDAGAFHNDVVAASHHDMLLHHELAFFEAESKLAAIAERYERRFGRPLRRKIVANTDLSINDAVATYLFNSQIVSSAETKTLPWIICPSQVQQHAAANAIVATWCEQGLFCQSQFIDLSQSMSGGGGPACLRLRVPMTPEEIEQIPTTSRWSEPLDQRLREVIGDTYPTSLRPAELADQSTLDAVVRAGSAVRSVLQGTDS